MATHVRHFFVMWLGGASRCMCRKEWINRRPTQYNASTQGCQAELLLRLCLCSLAHGGRREQPPGRTVPAHEHAFLRWNTCGVALGNR